MLIIGHKSYTAQQLPNVFTIEAGAVALLWHSQVSSLDQTFERRDQFNKIWNPNSYLTCEYQILMAYLLHNSVTASLVKRGEENENHQIFIGPITCCGYLVGMD